MGISNIELKRIVSLLIDKRSFDVTGYRASMLERRIQKRIDSTHTQNAGQYLIFLQDNPSEYDHLVDALTINVSHFFRDPLSFEYIANVIIPEVIHKKADAPDSGLRIWSAGCSSGEEPFSVAIILNEIMRKADLAIDLKIFATDIDEKTLQQAALGIYPLQRIEQVKHGLFLKYFAPEKDQFRLDRKIVQMVNFSKYDLLSPTSYTPPSSIFGAFDIVLCRNVLIYFNEEYQKIILQKLYKSLTKGGYLVLGESEVPVAEFNVKFKKETSCAKIYRKTSYEQDHQNDFL